MVCGVAAPGLAARPYFNRYSEDAIDLCDVLSSFSSQNKASLHELCRVMGLPGKPDGIGGADVERYCREGRVAEVAAYCETDVVNTYRVWLRYELFRGRLTEDGLQASEANLRDYMRSRSDAKPHPFTFSPTKRRGRSVTARSGLTPRVKVKCSYRIRPAFSALYARRSQAGNVQSDRDIGWRGNLLEEFFIVIVGQMCGQKIAVPGSDYVSHGCPEDGFGPANNCRAVTVGHDVAVDRDSGDVMSRHTRQAES